MHTHAPIKPYKIKTLLYLLVLSTSLCPFSIFSQGIENITFLPASPEFSDILKLRLELSPSLQEDSIYIRMYKWYDSNGDCKLKNEERKLYNSFWVFDNDYCKDIDVQKGVILLSVDSILNKGTLPVRYSIVLSTSDFKKVVHKNISSHKDVHQCLVNKNSYWNKIATIFASPIIKSIRLNFRGLNYQGAHGIYSYEFKSNQLKELIHLDSCFLLAPVLTDNHSKIAFISNCGSHHSVSWANLEDKQVFTLHSNGKDRTPYWLPDNESFLFVSDNRLALSNVNDTSVRIIDDNIDVSRLLKLNTLNGDSLAIFYSKHQENHQTPSEVYFMILDRQFNIIENALLLYSSKWALIKGLSPNNKLVFSKITTENHQKKSLLYIYDASSSKTEAIFDNTEANYYEPSWSKNGELLIFISDF